jgi:hypothetical protein
VLDAVVAFVGSDQGTDDGTLMRVGREYAGLICQAPKISRKEAMVGRLMGFEISTSCRRI